MNTLSFMTTIDTFQVSIRITYPDGLENRGSIDFLINAVLLYGKFGPILVSEPLTYGS